MFKPLKHPHVQILDGVKELIGQTGLITDKEGKLYCVKLDTPVEVPNVGIVTDDLWEPSKLKVIRPPVVKPVKAPAAVGDAPPIPERPQTLMADAEDALREAAAELPETAAAAEAAPPPAPQVAAPEVATPATPTARNSKSKPKALSAKAEAQQRAGVMVTDEPTKPKGKGKKLFTGRPKVDRK
jgi:hypothetical protein